MSKITPIRKTTTVKSSPRFDTEEIPFIVATDLLKQSEDKLKDQEVAAIAVALMQLLPDENDNSLWKAQSRLDSISRQR
ncbi:MAG: hypothetical protein H6619_05820 [Deltaproteobacteria bacterium]|nr:hypothetical protein [Deltaproteobacteria bacterium]